VKAQRPDEDLAIAAVKDRKPAKFQHDLETGLGENHVD
jgi:hypothetical protein